MAEFLDLIDSLLNGEAERWSQERLLHLRAVALDQTTADLDGADLDDQDAAAQDAVRFTVAQPSLGTGGDQRLEPVDDGGHEIAELTGAMSDPRYDCRLLQHATQGRALSTMLRHLLVNTLGTDLQKTSALARAVEDGYLANAYHNSLHAACVLHALYHVLHGGKVLDSLDGVNKQLVLLAAYLAAAAHDMRHPGVNNALLVNMQADLALVHNDQSVCENHHLCELFKLLKDPRMNVLHALDDVSYRFVRGLMIAMVLRTDMQQHNQTIREAREAHTTGTVQPQLTMQVALKVADISHATYPWATHCHWVDALEAEFFQQGDRERELGLEVSPMMDRSAPGLRTTQVAFLGVVVQPLIALFVHMFPSADHLLPGLQDNIQRWHREQA